MTIGGPEVTDDLPEECEDNACMGCAWCDAHGITNAVHPTRDADGQPLRTADLHRGYCFTCGAEDCGQRHVCPDPEYLNPRPPPHPFVRRWDPLGGYWVQCMVEKNGKAWDPKLGTYTDVRADEQLTAPMWPKAGEP